MSRDYKFIVTGIIPVEAGFGKDPCLGHIVTTMLEVLDEFTAHVDIEECCVEIVPGSNKFEKVK